MSNVKETEPKETRWYTYCAYCGETLVGDPTGDPSNPVGASSNGPVTDHLLRCTAHPLAAMKHDLVRILRILEVKVEDTYTTNLVEHIRKKWNIGGERN